MKSANLLNIYFDGTFVYIKGSLWDGFSNGMGGFTDGPCQIQNPETFFKNGFTAMDSILRLVLSGCLSQIISEQQCPKNAGRF